MAVGRREHRRPLYGTHAALNANIDEFSDIGRVENIGAPFSIQIAEFLSKILQCSIAVDLAHPLF